MLAQLSIRDIVLIERLDLSFNEGLSVLTGETGAGKSILLDSLALALGGRGDGDLVRQGCDKGQIVAVFDLAANHHVRDILKQNDIEDEGDIIIRRVQSADGRSRAFINDQPCSISLLRSIGPHFVEIHGQHDDRALIDVDAHRLLLDAFAGLEKDCEDVASLFSSMKVADRQLKEHRQKIETAAKEADWLRASVDELEVLSPQDGEEEELAESRSHMMKAEKIVSDIAEAQDSLSGHHSPIPSLNQLLRRLERKAAEVPGMLDDTIEALGRALDGLSDAQNSVDAALRDSEFNPKELEDTEERLFALRAASRKYNVPVANLSELASTMISDLAAIDAGEDKLHELEHNVQQIRADFFAASRNLSEKRIHASQALTQSVMAELPALKLERAEFIVDIQTNEEIAGANGIDQIEFHVRTNPGTRAGPIMKVASGGELSRFLLAIKVALADRGSAPTLVFDEIDTGVGGAVADAIGARLETLSKSIQVLSVTHAPQVAARAKTHLLISKSQSSEDSVLLSTNVRDIDLQERQEEIARMLAGATVTDEARAAAAKLLSNTG
ncbi:DNA repair protein RecN [Lentilitoribacter sp. Alg239-R112]|uniref:DNA repair protein RecN n=1 Tax=Lentilitoribacter sp. Alg239-R112 TaxID=2305987 RepID=UPI0013A69CEB|nr:DNA repair protein RecN [Lentilitoribacter sp. Alg239-R112]